MKSIFIRGMEFKPIPTYPGLFVSKSGRVASTRKGLQILKTRQALGYSYVSDAWNCHGKRYYLFVHRAVLMAWNRMPKAGEECRHLSGNKRNNRRKNLKWGTHAQNIMDMVKHGKRRGEKQHNAKLTRNLVIKARKMYETRSLSEVFVYFPMVSIGTLRQAISGKSWRHIPNAPKPHHKYPPDHCKKI